MSDNSRGPILDVPEPGFQLSRRLTVSLSIGLHAVILYAVSRAPWPEAEIIETTTAPVVWLSRTSPREIDDALREPPLPEPLPPPVPLAPTEPLVPSEPLAPPEPLPTPTEAADASESDDRDEADAAADERPAAPSETATERSPDASAISEPAGAESTGTESAEDTNDVSIADMPSTDVDWYAESRREIENLLDAIEAEQTFDVRERDRKRGLSSGPRGPKGTFEPGSSVSGPRLLTPNKSNSAFVQRLARLCNDLTGGGLGFGFSFFGLGGITGVVCAEDNARRDIFASVKPEYLKKLPDCREVAINTDAFADEDLPEELSAIKCRLVYKDELAGAALID
jgi:hypothetical protein